MKLLLKLNTELLKAISKISVCSLELTYFLILQVALQGIEFWSNVCDEEVDLQIEAGEAAEMGRPPEHVSRFYAKGALQVFKTFPFFNSDTRKIILEQAKSYAI